MQCYEETASMVAIAAGFLAVAAAALYAILRAVSPSVSVKGKTNIPGIRDGLTFPIIGDGWRFFGAADMIDVWNVIEGLNQKDELFSMWLGRILMIVVGEPKIAEMVLNSSKTTSKPLDFYGEFNMYADGVFSRNGKGWRNLRVALDELTHPKLVIDHYLDEFWVSAKKLCAVLDSKCEKGVFELGDTVRKIYVELITETVLGVPTNRFKDPVGYVECASNLAEKAFTAVINSVLKVHHKIPILNSLLKDKTIDMEISEIMQIYGPEILVLMNNVDVGLLIDEFSHFLTFLYFGEVPSAMCDSSSGPLGKYKFWDREGSPSTTTVCIRIRREILEENGCHIDDPDYTPECYTDVIIQTAKNENMRPERVYTMPLEAVVAGYDAPAVTVSSACLFLAMHPDYQEKAYQEQISIMGNSLEPPTQIEVAAMTYMEMLYKETLRHVAPPGIARLVESELVIDNYVFPEGSIVYVSTYTSRKDPKYWFKTKEFYPENFLPEEVAKRPKGVFLPFSAGSRSCAGKNVAHISIRIMLSTLLRRYAFTTDLKFEDIKYKCMVMLEPSKGYPVKVMRRRTENSS